MGYVDDDEAGKPVDIPTIYTVEKGILNDALNLERLLLRSKL